jgi:predicted esterase
MRIFRIIAGFFLLGGAGHLAAYEFQQLPRSACEPVTTPSSVIFADGFESGVFATLPPVRASNGSGGSQFVNSVTLPYPATPNFPLDAYIDASDAAGNSAPLPLVVAFHGAAGPGNQQFAAADLQSTFSVVVSDPNAQFLFVAFTSAGANGGWTINDDLGRLRVVLDYMTANYNVDLNRIYGWGFSAGGQILHHYALASFTAPQTPLFTAYTAHAGRLPSFFNGNQPESSPLKFPVMLASSPTDSVALYSGALNEQTRFINAGWANGQNFEFLTYDGGHTYAIAQMQAAWRFMCRHSLVPPAP